MIGLLRDRVSIERLTPGSPSTTGEVTGTWPSVASNVPASIQPRSGSYRQHEFGKDQQSDYRGFFAKGADVRIGDRIVFGSTRYVVTFVADYFVHHTEADLAQLAAL